MLILNYLSLFANKYKSKMTQLNLFLKHKVFFILEDSKAKVDSIIILINTINKSCIYNSFDIDLKILLNKYIQNDQTYFI